jgi:toxin FitB
MPLTHPVNRWIDAHRQESALSTVTIAEMARGIARLPTSKRSKSLSGFLDTLMKEYADAIFAFDVAAALAWGTLVSESERRGRTLGQHHSQIAAIALARKLVVVTRKVSDFPFVENVNP